MNNIICEDSLVWLEAQKDNSIKNIVTGIPDMEELSIKNEEEYIIWFNKVLNLIFKKIHNDGYVILVQTDRKYNRKIIDKSYIITNNAYNQTPPYRLLWHKIVCHRDVGKIDLHRPTYAHMLCYSINGKVGIAFEDVINTSQKLYKNGTPPLCCEKIMCFLLQNIHNQKRIDNSYDVVDLFCGVGTIGIYCIKNGLNYIGIDIDKEQCIKTRANLTSITEEIYNY